MSIDDQQTRTQLIEHFGSAVQDHQDVMAECLSLIRLYNLTPANLFFKYEAFLMSRPSGLRAKLSVLTLETARELRREIQREQQAQAVSSSTSTMAGASGSRDAGMKSTAGVKRGRNGHGDLGGLLNELTGGAASPRSNNATPTPARTGSSAAFTTPSRSSPIGPSGSHYRPSAMATGSSLQTPIARNGHSASPMSSPGGSGDESPGRLLASSPQPFRSRSHPHSLVETLNPHLPQHSVNPAAARPRISLSSSSNPKDWDYRYMFEKVSQRSEALDEQIDDFADIIRDAYGLEDLGDPHFVSDESIYTVGRILAPPTDTSKAQTNALFLESSRLLGSGRRVALRFPPGQVKMRGGPSGVKNYGVFPGCLVCVKGRNGGGGFFAVEEVLVAPPSPLTVTPGAELLDMQYGDKMQGQPMSIHVAAGPFSVDENLDYEPLQALMEVAEKERPDVLILMGPFVDAQHPIIASGAITRSVTDIFRDEVSARLSRFLSVSPATAVVLVPSIRDIVSHHVALPQAALDKEALGVPKKVKLLPNPCTFSVNEVNISLTTADILFHLRKEEVVQRVEEAEPAANGAGDVKDAMAGLVRHILSQRSFYPLFPVPETLASEINLDVTHQPLLRLDGPAPDVLILPSKLKHFSRVVDSTLVVNPAFTCRARTGGTFAKLSIYPIDRPQLELASDSDLEHSVFDRARAEIWRV